ncbi:MAG: DUF1456 family protein [Kangiellaceae bacterium]|nr:DUF1456 family protein [Kangiellaceae bacterium]
MTNNDILRRLRYTFDLNDGKMVAVFREAEAQVTRAQIKSWLLKDDDPSMVRLKDVELATFLNGLISTRRGKKEGSSPEPEQKLTHNMIFRKLKIAMNYIDDDILFLMKRAGFNISPHELSAFFRKPGHRNYRECKSQILRNFLTGLQKELRPKTDTEETTTESAVASESKPSVKKQTSKKPQANNKNAKIWKK